MVGQKDVELFFLTFLQTNWFVYGSLLCAVYCVCVCVTRPKESERRREWCTLCVVRTLVWSCYEFLVFVLLVFWTRPRGLHYCQRLSSRISVSQTWQALNIKSHLPWWCLCSFLGNDDQHAIWRHRATARSRSTFQNQIFFIFIMNSNQGSATMPACMKGCPRAQKHGSILLCDATSAWVIILPVIPSSIFVSSFVD